MVLTPAAPRVWRGPSEGEERKLIWLKGAPHFFTSMALVKLGYMAKLAAQEETPEQVELPPDVDSSGDDFFMEPRNLEPDRQEHER